MKRLKGGDTSYKSLVTSDVDVLKTILFDIVSMFLFLLFGQAKRECFKICREFSQAIVRSVTNRFR
jgi:hypothetical protein